MKTGIHIAAILIAGIGLGLFFRSMRSAPPESPAPEDIVYTPAVAPGEEVPEDLVPEPNNEVVRPQEDEAWLSRFELIERSGELIKSEQLLGQPYVVSFFFSTCPSICVQQNQKLKELQDAFEGRGVKFVAISVDPETDTPEQLREYAARFGADEDQWLFLTGDLKYIRRIGAELFSQPVDKRFHTERFVLVDRQGKIEGMYSWPEERQFEKLQASIESMLSEG
ncbi:MAG: SCO family protein [Planctomycetota bacterium]